MANRVRSQARAAAILATTLDLPGTRALARRSGTPQPEELVLAGSAATVVRPRGAAPWPALVFANGATPDGRAHPTVLRLGVSLARAGHLVYIPDLPGIAGGELSPATVTAAVEFTHAVADGRESAGGRVALAGVSIGASLALLTAAEPEVAERVSVVAGVAPYTDLARVMLLATTGTYRSGAGLETYPVPVLLRIGLARSLAAILRPSATTAALCAELRALDPLTGDPLAPFAGLNGEAGSVGALLANRDPAQFDDLFAALPAPVRATVETLSPVRAAHRLRAPVEIVTAPRDKYFPVAESQALVRATARARLTVTSLLDHAEPRLSPRYVAELGRLNGFFVRTLAAAG